MRKISDMNANDAEEVRARLLQMLCELDRDDARGRDAQGTVTLDQQAVGRLSRMDALQSQAMAKAQAARRAGQRTRIAAALTRLEAGEYGYCTDCGDELPPARLAADPTLPRCMSCTRG